MAKYRFVYTSFWEDPKVTESFTPEDKLFYLYILTNNHTTQVGIYRITKKLMAFELGYSIESITSLMDRFIEHHKLIKYNEETRELAIKNWGKYNLNKGGKPVIDCLYKELNEIDDKTLLEYVIPGIQSETIREIFLKFIKGGNSNESSTNRQRDVDKKKTKTKTKKKTKTKILLYRRLIPNQKKQTKPPLSDAKTSDTVATELERERTPYFEIIELYNKSCKSLPKMQARSKQRDKAIKCFWKRFGDLMKVEDFFKKIEKSDFLSGRSGKWLNCGFDWILKESNIIKIQEGNYDNKVPKKEPPKPPTIVPKESAFTNYDQRKYNFDDLEKKMFGWK